MPALSPMLAKVYDPAKAAFPLFSSPKLDGMRAIITRTPSGTTATTREGNPIEAVPHILEAFAGLPCGVYDGELMHPAGFQTTAGICRRSAANLHPDRQGVAFHAFDLLSLEDWEHPTAPAARRFEALGRCLDQAPDALHLVEHHLVRSEDQLAEMHYQNTRAGFEGTMAQLDRPYEHRRSQTIMKIKDFTSAEARVLEVEPGAGQFEGMMGRLVCQSASGQIFRLGTGFETLDRAQAPTHWIGRLVEFKHQGQTDSGAPRFPVFLRMRVDLEL